MSNFKGTKNKWSVHYNEYGHITSVRSEDSNRTIFTSKVNNMCESNANMVLAQHAPEMLEMLERIRDNGVISQAEIVNLIKKATE